MSNHHERLRVVITGASSGIGQATAERFAGRGARLVLGARNVEALQTVANRCKAAGGDATAVHTDVTAIDSVRALADAAMSELGGIDVWVSNAGVGAVGRYEDTPMESHDRVVRTNLIGHMNDAHAVLPIFLKQHYGTFVNMISLGGFAAAPFAVAYSASKFGLRGFTEAVRAEVADHPDIHICDVYPGFVDTPGLRHGANYVGRRITAPPPVIGPVRVAAAIVRLTDKPKPTTMVGATSVLTRGMHAISPAMTSRAMLRLMTLYFRRAERVPTGDGNLFEPSTDAAVIEGGLRSPKQRAVAGVAVGSVIGALGLAARKRSGHRA
ncbi:short-chain dehydrogenase [Mycobacterium sp. GA-1841]|uniref:SDR family oxidoreductase n=1 Tax=Mycobacterium sp. GA-1841 TaxID=1834154 RepID=UPI00096F2E71|nr:SDR family oxidoreductase [Mycobacterium sp. GA-1841]OMC38755.1 short-chain dehydrogenase [Mycobacterium sp. GA-1841]